MPELRDERRGGPGFDELEDDDADGTRVTRRRRWFGRRREEAGRGVLEEPTPAEPDWNAVVADAEPLRSDFDWSDSSPSAAVPPGGQPGHDAPTGIDLEPPASTLEPWGKEPDWSEWAPTAPLESDLAPAAPPAPPVEPAGATELEPAELDELAETTESEPTKFVELAETTESDRSEPAEATDQALPLESADSSEPGESPESTDASEPSEPGMPAVSTEPVDSSLPAEPADSSESSEDLTVAIWETLSDPPAESGEPGGGLAGVATPSESPAPTGSEPPAEAEPRYRTSPSWPPPRKPRVGVGFLSLLVMVIMVALLVTNGQIGGSPERSEADRDELPALQVNPDAVPKDWIVYRHPTGGFGISHPPGWTLRDDGSVVQIQDPSSRAELRIEQRRPPGKTDPEDEWLEDERVLSARSAGYRRLQLSEATYQGHLAALWEYTVPEGGVSIHAADLEFVTKKDRFTLNFRGPVTEWQGLLPTFQGFLSSFKPPK